MTRRLPRPSEILPLIGGPDRTKTGLQRRLERCATVADVRALARRRVPRAVFDYVDGAAGSETSLARSRAAYARVEFAPRVLRDVSSVDLGVELLGQRSALPFAFAPTGFTRLMHDVGEPDVARVAGERGIPTLSRPWARPVQKRWPRRSPPPGAGSSCTCREIGPLPRR